MRSRTRRTVSVDRRLIRLEEFAARRVQLVPVPVERDVAAGNHDARFMAGKGEVRQRRSGNAAGEYGAHAGIPDCLLNGLPEHGRTGAEVGGDVEHVARNDAAIGGRQRLEVLQLSEHVHVNLELCHFGEAAAAAAGAEFQFGRLPEEARAEGHSLLVYQNGAALNLHEARGNCHANQGAGPVHIQLLHEAVTVARGGFEGDAQMSSDLLGRFSFGNALEHLQLRGVNSWSCPRKAARSSSPLLDSCKRSRRDDSCWISIFSRELSTRSSSILRRKVSSSLKPKGILVLYAQDHI